MKLLLLLFLIGLVVNQNFGELNFVTSCNPATNTSFNHAVSILHSFWYDEAFDRFSEITKAYPTCAIAYWGMAMSLYFQIWEQPTQRT
jgi:TolA-binding protein